MSFRTDADDRTLSRSDLASSRPASLRSERGAQRTDPHDEIRVGQPVYGRKRVGLVHRGHVRGGLPQPLYLRALGSGEGGAESVSWLGEGGDGVVLRRAPWAARGTNAAACLPEHTIA